jgi:hypothetical protein
MAVEAIATVGRWQPVAWTSTLASRLCTVDDLESDAERSVAVGDGEWWSSMPARS